MPRWRATMKAADMRPKIAPEAPTVISFGLSSRAPNEPASRETK